MMYVMYLEVREGNETEKYKGYYLSFENALEVVLYLLKEIKKYLKKRAKNLDIFVDVSSAESEEWFDINGISEFNVEGSIDYVINEVTKYYTFEKQSSFKLRWLKWKRLWKILLII